MSDGEIGIGTLCRCLTCGELLRGCNSGKTQGSNIGLAVAAGTLASFLYGIGVNLVRRQVAGWPAAAVAAATLSCAALFTLPVAVVGWPRGTIARQSCAATIALGVVCTGIAFVLYYRLMQRIGGARAATVNYRVPLLGVTWVRSLLGEVVTSTMSIAAGTILGSVALSQRTQRSFAHRWAGGRRADVCCV